MELDIALINALLNAASGHLVEGISWIEEGIKDYRATGSILDTQFHLALKAEALHLAHRTAEALEAIKEADALVERSEARWWSAGLHLLRGVFLMAGAGDHIEIESSFREAIFIARQQKSTSLARRAQATLAEYRRQKAGTSGDYQFRLPL